MMTQTLVAEILELYARLNAPQPNPVRLAKLLGQKELEALRETLVAEVFKREQHLKRVLTVIDKNRQRVA